MTEREQGTPEVAPEDTPLEPDETELAADDELSDEEISDAQLSDEELDARVDAAEESAAFAPGTTQLEPPARRSRRAAEAAAAAAAGRAGAGARIRGLARRAAPAGESPSTPSEVAVRIDDRISQVFVVGVIVVFAAILLYGLLFGAAGVFTPLPTPSPVPSASAPAPSGSESAAPSAAPSTSPATSPSGSPSASAS